MRAPAAESCVLPAPTLQGLNERCARELAVIGEQVCARDFLGREGKARAM